MPRANQNIPFMLKFLSIASLFVDKAVGEVVNKVGSDAHLNITGLVKNALYFFSSCTGSSNTSNAFAITDEDPGGDGTRVQFSPDAGFVKRLVQDGVARETIDGFMKGVYELVASCPKYAGLYQEVDGCENKTLTAGFQESCAQYSKEKWLDGFLTSLSVILAVALAALLLYILANKVSCANNRAGERKRLVSKKPEAKPGDVESQVDRKKPGRSYLSFMYRTGRAQAQDQDQVASGKEEAKGGNDFSMENMAGR